MEEKHSFACAVNCMDGRIQDAVKNYMKENYGVDYVDMVTEPGPNKILADNLDTPVINNIVKRVKISVHHHGSKLVAIVGHEGCAGNPVSKEEQIQHLKNAREIFAPQCKDATIILLWVGQGWDKAELVE